MATLGGIDLGDIQSEDQSKDSGLFQTPLPAADSDSAILIDIFGVFRTITVTGVITGVLATQTTFISSIEGIVNGSQSGSTFVSTTGNSYSVMVQNFSWTKAAADENKLSYTLTLFQGGL